ncbi:MAG: Ig-like domain-containing protein, partial [Blastocatellia bacterium]
VQVDPTGPLALGLSGPASLAVVNNQYSPNPFDITATIQNTGVNSLTNVQLTLNLPPDLGLAGGTATVTIGNLPAGQERQFSWRVATGPRTGAGTLTYSVTASAANTPSKTLSRTITLPTISVTHSLSGTVGIWDGREIWKLDGDTIKLTVSARHASNGLIEKELQFRDGTYSFDNLPADTYNIVAKLEYKDEVTVDNRKFPRGCANQSLPKDTEIRVNSVEVRGKTEVNIDFPPPMVMVHGYPSCYDKWYQKPETKPDPKLTHWDNFARALGGITFTPNYEWRFLPSQSSWSEPMKNVEEQVANNFKRLTKDIDRRGGRFPGWFYIAHSTGGLVGRVLVYQNEESKLVQALKKLYLLGTPNSGAYGRAWVEYVPFVDLLAPEPGRETYPVFYYISENAIRNDFNKKYRSFRNKEVMVFAGNINSFFVPNADGVVRVDSVYNIETKRNVLSFRDLGRIELNGETFSFQHEELGSLASLKPILIDRILPDITRIAPLRTQTQSTMSNEITLAVAQGTSSNYDDAEAAQTNTGFSSAQLRKVLTGGQTLAAAQTATHNFTVSVTDVAIVNPLSLNGAATFALVDPAGRTIPFAAPPPDVAERINDEFGETLILRNPTPGPWQLRTTAGAAGATFIFLVMENSPAGIEVEVKETSLTAGQTATIGARVYGNLQQASVTARVVNAIGNTVATVALFDDGQHQDGTANDGVFAATTPSLTSNGRHYAVVTANGVFNGRPVARQSEATIDVLGPSRLLSGSFKDAGYDAGNDGRLDAVRVTVGFSALAAGSYLLSGDLLDAQGFLLAHAVGSVEATAAGSYSANLDFYLTGKVCGHFSGAFTLRNVTLSSGADFRTLDVWNTSVSTQSYDGALFNCSSASLAPRPVNVQPEAMFPGSSGQVLISGSGFATALRVSFGAGVTVAAVTRINSNLLAAQISVAANATPGVRELNITNPDGISTTAPGLFSVASDRPPTVNFSYPADRQIVRGTVTASAAAEDDRGVQRVEFYLDGQLVATDIDFPYQFVWNTSASSNGNHTLTVRAYDTLGQSREARITVVVGSYTVASVSAASFSGAALAAESIVAAFGSSLATSVQVATSLPLPTSLAGTTVKVKDSSGAERSSPLFFVASLQVNYLIPPGTANGTATITITSGDGVSSTGTTQIVTVAPGLFSANASGQGVAAAIALRVRADGSQSFEAVARFDSAQNKFVAVPIDLGPPTDQIFLLLFGTGWRLNSGLPSVMVKIGGVDAEVLYAGPQSGFVGLDQLNVRLLRTLAGRGEVDLVLTVDGKAANTLKVGVR